MQFSIDYSKAKKSSRILSNFVRTSSESAFEMVKSMKLHEIREIEVKSKLMSSAKSTLYTAARQNGFSMKIGHTFEGAKKGNVILVFRKVKLNPGRGAK